MGFLVQAARLAKISLLTTIFLLLFLFRRLGGRNAGPWLLRWYLQSCGAGYVKFGQILAMRYDLLPPAYCEELMKLLDRTRPVRMKHIREVIERELGRPLKECFATFEEKPLGSASIAQAHRATLPGGERVVVKVRRPGIEVAIRFDLTLLAWMAQVVDASGLLFRTRLTGLVTSYIRLTEEELDFCREARNAQLLHELMAADPVDHRAPRVYFERSGKTVLTLECFEGVWMYELLAAVQHDDREKLEAWAQRGITPRRTARLLFRSIMEQCYHHRVFHADPHAGNLVLLDGGTLGFIDFGMVGWLDERSWAQQYRLFDAISREQLHASYEAMLDTLEPLAGRDLGRFEADFKSLLRDWILAARSPHASIRDKSTGRFLLSATDAIRRSYLELPWTTMRLHRTTMISDMIELKLHPEIDLVEEMREFFQIEAGRQAQALVAPTALADNFYSLAQVLFTAPAHLRTATAWFQSRLPDAVRQYREGFSRIERVVGLFLRLGRMSAWIVGAISGVGFLASLGLPSSLLQVGWLQARPLAHYPLHYQALGLCVGSLTTALFLGVLINWYEDPS